MPKTPNPNSETSDAPQAEEEFPATDQYVMFGRIELLRLRAAKKKREKDANKAAD